MSNGGRYFNLANWKDADVLAGIGRPARSFLSAAIEGGEVKDLYPQQPQPLAGRFTLVGKLSGETATVNVNYGIPGGKPDKRTFKVSRADAVEGSLLRRLWAQKKLAHLMIHQKANEKEIAALGKQFGLVTPYTSLLVLDSLEQYVQYEIAPPKSLVAMREEYMRRIDTVEHQKQKQKADKLAEVIRMWDERVKWWNSEFKYAKDFKYKEQEGQGGGFGGMGGGGMGGISGADAPAANAPAPAVAPAAAAAARSASARGSPASPGDAAVGRTCRLADALPALPRRCAAPVQMVTVRGPRGFGTASISHRSRHTDPWPYWRAKRGRWRPNPAVQTARQPGIVIKPWQPDMPYLKDLRAAKGKADLFAVYMKNRAQYGTLARLLP